MFAKRLALLTVFLAGLAVALAPPSSLRDDAEAHDSDCHAQQSCPSDDQSYVWYDSAGRGWDCALSTAPNAAVRAEATVLSYDGSTYACFAVAPTSTTPTETATPTEPVPPPAATPDPPLREQVPAGKKTRRGSPAAPAASTPPASRIGPIRSFLGVLSPRLTAGGYVFPVYGPASFSNDYRAPRATTAWHHGNDIFAPLGAPVLAVAAGTIFSVGWNDVGGNRFWLRDRYGNHFYYAHLSGFTPLAVDGARVAAGAVIGFVGNTGDAAGTPYHLHFEIHPASKLHLGYDGVINPYAYLLAWQRLQDVRLSPADARFAAAAGWATPLVRGSAPKPGAVLLQLSDISRASGLDRGSLQRAFSSVKLDADLDPLFEGQVSDQDRSEQRSQEAGSSADLFHEDVAGKLRWDLLAQCEAGGDWGANTGNGYSGGLQFHPGTWVRYGGLEFAESAHLASRPEQIVIAERVLASEGWEAWPACSLKIGLR